MSLWVCLAVLTAMHPSRLALRREGTYLSEGEYGTSHPSISLVIMATYGACISTAEMSQVQALSMAHMLAATSQSSSSQMAARLSVHTPTDTARLWHR